MTTSTPAPARTPSPCQRLITLLAWATLILTIALPLGEALTTPTPAPAPTTSSTPPAPSQTSDDTRPTKADKAAAHHDGCRQTPSSDGTLLARPSCHSGMPITRDHMTQAPDSPSTSPHTGAHPIAPNEVPPAWADHWGAAAHSPHHRSQA